MSMAKKASIAAGVIVVIAAAIAAGWWWTRSGSAPGSGNAGNNGTPQAVSGAATSTTRSAVPANVVVPDKGATSTPAGLAVPVVQGAGDVSGNVSYRSFAINVANGAYSPDIVAVHQGDTVDLEITAVDANYGFTQPDYGFNATILKGKTQRIQFQALTTGDFTFYCASCGGPSKGPVGHLIVAAK